MINLFEIHLTTSETFSSLYNIQELLPCIASRRVIIKAPLLKIIKRAIQKIRDVAHTTTCDFFFLLGNLSRDYENRRAKQALLCTTSLQQRRRQEKSNLLAMWQWCTNGTLALFYPASSPVSHSLAVCVCTVRALYLSGC